MKIIKKLKAIKAIIFSDEYFVSVANQKNPYGKICDGPSVYEYFSNTNRNMFYIFIKDYITKFNK